MAIDDRIAKIQELVPDDDSDFFSENLVGALATAGGVFSPIIAVAATVRAVLSAADERNRIFAAIRAMCDEFYAIRQSVPSNADEALKSKWFRRATGAVIQEAARAEDEDRATLLALVAVHGCFPDDENKHRQEDLAGYIRDLAQLGSDDVRMLKLLEEVYRPALRVAPNINRDDMFVVHLDDFKSGAQQAGFHPDDSVAIGARLSGFGLAYEIPRVTTRQSPMESFFRPTRRGLYLLSLLSKAEESLLRRKTQ
jgi:hypothetical protein